MRSQTCIVFPSEPQCAHPLPAADRTDNLNGPSTAPPVLLEWLYATSLDIAAFRIEAPTRIPKPRSARGIGAICTGRKSNGGAILAGRCTPTETRRGLPGDRMTRTAATRSWINGCWSAAFSPQRHPRPGPNSLIAALAGGSQACVALIGPDGLSYWRAITTQSDRRTPTRPNDGPVRVILGRSGSVSGPIEQGCTEPAKSMGRNDPTFWDISAGIDRDAGL